MLLAELLSPGLICADNSLTAEDSSSEDDWGDGEGWGEDADSAGFADVSADVMAGIEESAGGENPSRWRLGGFFRTEWALWTERFEDNPFAKGRQNLDLVLRYKGEILRLVVSGHGEYDVAYLYQRDSYDQPTLDAYEWLLDVRESYLAVTFGEVELSIGRQIVVWGEGDMVSLVDVASPRDLREPGLADLDDLRLPVLSTRIGLFVGYHRIEALVIHESNFGYRPPPFGLFSPLPAFLPDDVVEFLSTTPVWYKHKQALFSLNTQQVLLRWGYKGPGIDLALYVASVLDQQGVIELDYQALLSGIIIDRSTDIVLNHHRYIMVGHSGAWPVDSWLFKWEISAEKDRNYNTGDQEAVQPELSDEQAASIGGLLGITYSGLKDTMLFLEIKKSWLLEDLPDVLFPVEEPSIALRYTHDVLDGDMTLALAGILFGWNAQHGWLARATVSYTILDGLKAGLGFITYQPGIEVGMLSGAKRHDRVWAKLRWDFNIL
ncbi:MAG: hypothetical protein QNJ97_05770 [Myxococcota bacterium]|nr:hypothetical protein [Myxococcota bacterium]